MTYLRLDDNMPEHPKVAKLSDRAFRVHLRGLAYSSRMLSNGKVPVAVANAWGRAGVRELLSRELWYPAGEDYEIHDYLDWNPTRDQVQSIREARAKAGAKGGSSKRGSKRSSKTEAEGVGVGAEGSVAPALSHLAVGKTASAAAPRPSEDHTYLANRINERWPGTAGRLSAGALQRLANDYGLDALDSAIREMHGFPPDEVRSPFAYLRQMLADRGAA